MADPKWGAPLAISKDDLYILSEAGKPVHKSVVRDPMGFLVNPTGLAESNVAAMDFCAGLAEEKGLKLSASAVILGGDVANNRVVLWFVDPLSVGAVALRVDDERKMVTLYLHELFDKKPALRPTEPRWCAIGPAVDDDGYACAVISLRVALEQRKHKRKAVPPSAATGSGS